MHILPFRLEDTPQCVRLSAEIRHGTAQTPFTLSYELPGGTPIDPIGAGTGFVAGIVPLAMALGEEIVSENAVSARVLGNLPAIQAVLHAFEPAWREVPVRAPAAAPRGEPAHVASFFSLGADSFYTLLTNIAPETPPARRISHLVFINGFDLRAGQEHLYQEALRSVERVARECGCDLVPVATNLRELTDPHVDYRLSHGTALASVGLLLSGLFRTILIPATSSYAAAYPCGSHPLLDPCWSMETTEFIHHGLEAGRVVKLTEHVAKSPLALQTLRVCWENRGGAYNCGQCGKCLRTMLTLDSVGALEKCATFPHAVSRAALRRLKVTTRLTQIFTAEVAAALRGRPEHRWAVALLDRSLRRYDREYVPHWKPWYAPIARRVRKLVHKLGRAFGRDPRTKGSRASTARS